MNIALFGGTFDPIHAGHLRAAKVAAHKFRLGKILFVPSGNPPHKRGDRLTPFAHRFAMAYPTKRWIAIERRSSQF